MIKFQGQILTSRHTEKTNPKTHKIIKYINYYNSTTGADAQTNGTCHGNYTFSQLDEYERRMHFTRCTFLKETANHYI